MIIKINLDNNIQLEKLFAVNAHINHSHMQFPIDVQCIYICLSCFNKVLYTVFCLLEAHSLIKAHPKVWEYFSPP